MARGLGENGIGSGGAVALWAPNSPAWIAAALAVLVSGGMLVPIDDMADAEQFEAALNSSDARMILTTTRHLDESGAVLRTHNVTVIRIDEDTRGGQAPSNRLAEDLPVPAGDDPAVLSWTSGTTGSPKAFVLTHRNIAANVEALQQLGVVGPRDRALLPLPLHHAYPLIVGMLTTLTLGSTIVLPGSTTGPALMRALREGNATTIIGVPRLYEALCAAIETRLKGYHRTLPLAFRTLLKVTIFVQQTSGIRPGRFLFAPVRHGIAPNLRLLVSGGARLEGKPRNSWKLSAGRFCRDMASRKPRRCSPAIARTLIVWAAPGVRSPTARFGLRTPTIRGSARLSCVEARLQGAMSTIRKPISKHLLRMDGSARVTWGLSIGMVFCLLLGGPRKSWYWAAAKR